MQTLVISMLQFKPVTFLSIKVETFTSHHRAYKSVSDYKEDEYESCNPG